MESDSIDSFKSGLGMATRLIFDCIVASMLLPHLGKFAYGEFHGGEPAALGCCCSLRASRGRQQQLANSSHQASINRIPNVTDCDDDATDAGWAYQRQQAPSPTLLRDSDDWAQSEV